MKEKWIWLPDWASDLSLWEDDLTDASASASHTFVPYEKMAQSLDDVYAIEGLSKADTVVGWGMGCLLLMLGAAKRPKGQNWIFLSPYADFCDEEGPWNSESLRFKARDGFQSSDVLLYAFKEQIGEEYSDWPDEWADAARKMDAASLSDGLKFLASHRVDSPVADSENIQVLYGRMDQDVVPPMTLRLKEILPKATFKERPKAGHWPPMLLF